MFEWLLGRRVQSVSYVVEGEAVLRLILDDGSWIACTPAWHVRSANKVIVTSGDDGQRYGRAEPICVAAEIQRVLEGQAISAVEVDEGTRDVRVDFTSGHRLVTFTTSLGYEGWMIGCSDGRRWVQQGSSDIASWTDPP